MWKVCGAGDPHELTFNHMNGEQEAMQDPLMLNDLNKKIEKGNEECLAYALTYLLPEEKTDGALALLMSSIYSIG